VSNQGKPPAFGWGDRYDARGLLVGVAIFAVCLAFGATVWLALGIGAGMTNVTSYALRRRAGIPGGTLWHRALYRYRQRR
jgi:hypothetical protein